MKSKRIFQFIFIIFFLLYLFLFPLEIFAADYTMKQNPFPEPWSNTILDFSKCTVKRGSGFSLSHSTDGSKMWSGFNTSKNSNYSVLYENVFHRGDQYWDMRIYFWCNNANGYAIRADGSTSDGITSRANLKEVLNGSQSFNYSLSNVFDAEFHFYKHGETKEDPDFKGILWWIDLDTNEGVKSISGIKDCYRVSNTTVTKRSDGWYRGTKSSEEVSESARLIVVMTTNSGISHIKYDACSSYGTNYGRSINNITYTLSSLSEYQPNKTILTSPVNKYGTYTVLSPQQPVDKYQFFGWYSDNACTQKVTKINMVSANTKLYGRYERVYDVVTLGEHVTIDNSIPNIVKGSSKTVNWTVEDGYFITDVIVDGVSQPVVDILSGSTTFSNINEDHIVTVKAKKCYEITTEVENGTISPSITHLYPNEERTITYSPMDGYMIKEVIVDGEDKDLTTCLNDYKFGNINTNHHIKVVYEKIPTQDLQVIGIWNDDDNRDGYRPDNLEISYLVNNKEQEIINLSEANEWKAEKVNLPLYTQYRKPITYNFKALEYEYINKYKVSDENTGLVFKFINKHEPERVESKITKVWDDTNNHDGFRPSEINVELYKNKQLIKTVTLNNANNWTYSESNLYKYDHIGNTNFYHWKEIKNYTNENKYSESIEQESNNTTITNTHIPEKIESKVTKIWDDNNNQDGIRPSSIEVKLYRNDTVIKTLTLNESNNWVHNEIDLDKYNSTGQLYTYYWKEIEDYPNHNEYKTSEKQDGYNTTITNTHELDTVESKVIKVWNDFEDNDGFRPEVIYVKLYQDDKILKNRIALTESNSYTYTESNLPKYHDEGKEYQYHWDEYLTYENTDKYTYTKEQNGNDTTIINAHELETVDVQVQKVWEDNNNHDRLRPSEIEVSLLANNKPIQTIKLNNLNSWKTTISDLPKYEQGKEVSYTFEEIKPYGDYVSQVETKKNITVITNSRTDYTTSVSITKEWADNNDQDGIRPQEIQVQLFANNESIDNEIILNSENNWTQMINNLPLNNNDGEEIVYSVEELKEYDGYTCKVEKTNNTFKLINAHEPETVSFSITKEWNDNNNQDGLRPNEIIVKLYRNGEETNQKVILNEANGWAETLDNLPKYKDGVELDYKFVEENISNYESNLEIQNNKVVITNTHVPETKNITIQKEWNDANNRYGVRPDKVEVRLLANGEQVKNISLSEENNWVETIKNLPVNANGKPIDYFVEEMNVMAYQSKISKFDDRFIITNEQDLTVHGPEEMVIGIQKIWDDDNNRDYIRPEKIRVNLLVNDKYYKGYTLNEANNWQVQISNLTGANGKVKYSWEEEIPDNYANELSEKDGITTITNSYTPEITTATVNKIWDDDNNQDGIRPKEVTVVLLANDEPTGKTLTLSDENDWHGIITNLPKNKDGEKINYTFKLKDSIKKYTTSYNFDFDSNTTIIKSLYKTEEVEAIVENEWIDDNNRDGIRPKEVEVVLMNKEHVALDAENNPITIKLSEDNNWSAKVETLPKYTNGIENQYLFRVKDEIDNYVSTYEDKPNKTKIINEHLPEKVTLEVQKVWEDDNDRDKVRPDEVTVVLMNNNEPTDMKLVLSKDNEWYGEIKNQFKYENGKEIVYNFVLENEIDKYQTFYNQENYKTIITSIYESEKVQPEVKVIWDDLDNQFSKRPDEVVVSLYIDEESSDIVLTLNKKNNWYTQLEEMPRYKDGKKIEYKFIENDLDDYKVSYKYDTSKTIITNFLREEKPTEESTKTEETTQAPENTLKKIEESSIPTTKIQIKEQVLETSSDRILEEDGTVEKVKTSDNSNLWILYILIIITSIGLIIKYKKK